MKDRYLSVAAPAQVDVGKNFAVVVWITRQPRPDWAHAALGPFPLGTDLTITVVASDLVCTSDLEQTVHVPVRGDSDPIRFGFTGRRPGLHTVLVLAYHGGTFLGQLTTQISVQAGKRSEPAFVPPVRLDAAGAQPGEVTLQVSRTGDGRYSFHLISHWSEYIEHSERLAGDPRRVVDHLVTELCDMATGDSPYAPSEQHARLRSLGVRLWADAVPLAIRRQFWAYRDRFRCFTIINTVDDIPWELAYPLDEFGDDAGFLAEQLPVIRRTPGGTGTRSLTLTSSAFVVPPVAPSDALDEVHGVRARLGSGVRDRGLIDKRRDLDNLLNNNPPSVLHFAGHNQFSDDTGSSIQLDGGPFQPTDLFPARQLRTLRRASPLVFFNACRTAGKVPGLTKTMSWADMFMAAGAGAFLGSLWAVRSRAARDFADAFYRNLVTHRQPLGNATLEARREIRTDDGDPTWLAYTIYGNPSARIT